MNNASSQCGIENPQVYDFVALVELNVNVACLQKSVMTALYMRHVPNKTANHIFLLNHMRYNKHVK